MSRVIQSVSRRVPDVTAASTIAATRSGCCCAYASASVTPHEPPETTQRSMPRCAAQQLDVADQMLGRVGGQVGRGAVGQRPGPPAAALVEQHRPVRGRVEAAPDAQGGAGARPAVQPDRRRAGRVAHGLPVERVPVADVEEARLVRLDRRVALSHRRPSAPPGSRWASCGGRTRARRPARRAASHRGSRPPSPRPAGAGTAGPRSPCTTRVGTRISPSRENQGLRSSRTTLWLVSDARTSAVRPSACSISARVPASSNGTDLDASARACSTCCPTTASGSDQSTSGRRLEVGPQPLVHRHRRPAGRHRRDQHQRADPVGVVERDELGHRAAHRDPHQAGGPDPVRVEHADRVGDQLGAAVVRLARRVVHGLPGVAQVVPDHEPAAGRELRCRSRSPTSPSTSWTRRSAGSPGRRARRRSARTAPPTRPAASRSRVPSHHGLSRRRSPRWSRRRGRAPARAARCGCGTRPAGRSSARPRARAGAGPGPACPR